MNGSFSFRVGFPLSLPLEDVAFGLKLANDGLGGGVVDAEVLGSRVDRDILFEDHVNEPLSDLN